MAFLFSLYNKCGDNSFTCVYFLTPKPLSFENQIITIWYFICSMTESSREVTGFQPFMDGSPECCLLLKELEVFPVPRPQSGGETIKTSWWLDAVTLRYCSISVMAGLPSILARLSRFRTQKSNYGLLYIKALICYCGEGQRASFVCSLHSSQRSVQRRALHFSTFTALHLNIYQR